MEKAKTKVADYLNEKAENSIDLKEQEFKEKMDKLKPSINNLLHMYLPGDITMEETEALAMVINDMIWNPRDYLNKKS